MNLILGILREAARLAPLHTYIHTHTHTHTTPPTHTLLPKFRLSARGGWGSGGIKGCPDNGEKKSECLGLGVYLAGGSWGPEGARTAHLLGGVAPALNGAVTVFRGSPPLLLPSYPRSRFLPTFFSLSLSCFYPPSPLFLPQRT
jgi:hypothetical protein